MRGDSIIISQVIFFGLQHELQKVGGSWLWRWFRFASCCVIVVFCILGKVGVELEVYVLSTLTLIKHFCNIYNFIAWFHLQIYITLGNIHGQPIISYHMWMYQCKSIYFQWWQLHLSWVNVCLSWRTHSIDASLWLLFTVHKLHLCLGNATMWAMSNDL